MASYIVLVVAIVAYCGCCCKVAINWLWTWAISAGVIPLPWVCDVVQWESDLPFHQGCDLLWWWVIVRVALTEAAACKPRISTSTVSVPGIRWETIPAIMTNDMLGGAIRWMYLTRSNEVVAKMNLAAPSSQVVKSVPSTLKLVRTYTQNQSVTCSIW